MSLSVILVYLLFLVVAVFLVFSRINGIADDPGLGWHLKSGIEIISSGQIPRIDSYLGLSSSPQWVADQWLGSTILASGYLSGGWPRLHIGVSLLSLLLFTVIYPIFLIKFTNRAIESYVVSLLCLMLGFLQFVIRPVSFSIFFFTLAHIWLFSLLRRIRDGGTPKSIEWIVGGVFIALWTNIHPYVILFFISCGILFFGYLIERIVEKKALIDRSGIISLVVFPLFLLLFTLCNPYFLELHKSVLMLGKSEFLTSFLQEWSPLNFSSGAGRIFQLVLFLAFVGYVSKVRKEEKLYIPELLLAFAYIRFGIESVRAVPLAAFILAPFAVYGISTLIDFYWFARFPLIEKGRAKLHALSKNCLHVLPKIASIATIFYCVIFFTGTSLLSTTELGPSKTKYPYDALGFLRSYDAEHNEPLRILNNINWGGFLIFHLEDKVKPLFDDRLTLQPEEVFKEYNEGFVKGKDWREFVDSQAADILLIEKESVLGRILRSAAIVAPIYSDELAAIYKLPLEDVEGKKEGNSE